MSDKRPGRSRAGSNANQLQIDWNGVTSTPPVDSAEESHSEEPIATVATAIRPTAAADHEPVLRLRWDFRTRFPEPLPEVVDAGAMSAEDASLQSIEAIHLEHGRRMLRVLSDLDAAMDERRQHPSDLTRSNADSLTEPTRLERWYSSLLGVYEDWFGKEAAGVFDRAVRAWHAHIEVVVDRSSTPSSNGAVVSSVASPPPAFESQNSPPPFVDAEVCDPSPAPVATSSRLPALTAKRIIARSPVPKPLPAAVATGHFGIDEQGKPINPSGDEVYAITSAHAEKLIDLIQTLPGPGRPASPTLETRIRVELAEYAEDFGEHAAQQLEAYCRRQARVRDPAPEPRGR